MHMKMLLGLLVLGVLVLLPVGNIVEAEKPTNPGKPFHLSEDGLASLTAECSISSIDCENRVIYVNDLEACEGQEETLIDRAEAACAPIAN